MELIQSLSSSNRYNDVQSLSSVFRVGIILDGWMFAIKNEALKISQPLLFLNTQTFHIKSNLAALKKIIDDGENRSVYTVL